jgi:outer membrane lipoprotein-sorting protein
MYYKKTLIALTIILGVMITSAQAQAGVNKGDQVKITNIMSSLGLQTHWPQDISLWVKASGYSKFEMEAIGNQICASTRHAVGFYVITFWHQFGHGKITKVNCS